MRHHRLALAAATLALAFATGCSAQTDQPSEPPAAASAQEQLLATHDLEGLSAQQVVEQLDRSPEPRPLALGASVQPDQVLLSDADTELALDLPDDVFYLSVAPYVSSTHDCFHHSLATCRGELADEEVQVRITDDTGEVLVDEQVTTYANGFVGFWLPRDISGTIEVELDGRTGTQTFSTGADDPTCLTTLQLSA